MIQIARPDQMIAAHHHPWILPHFLSPWIGKGGDEGPRRLFVLMNSEGVHGPQVKLLMHLVEVLRNFYRL